MGRFGKLFGALTLVFAMLATLGPGAAGVAAGWHWRRSSNPASVQLVDSTTAGWHDQVHAAAARWTNKSGAIEIAVDNADQSAATRQSCPAPNGAIRVCNSSYGGRWAGLTEVTLNGQHIVSGRIKLNDNVGSGIRRAVACHEIGHALGLGHRRANDTSSCMTATVRGSQRSPDRKDIRSLARIYSHGDGGGGSSSPTTADTVTHQIETERNGALKTIRIYSFVE